MKRLFCAALAAMVCVFSSFAVSPDYAGYVDTRVGTASSRTMASGLFGKGSEEHGQTIPAVLVPYGMNFWTPQTRDTERKCVAPYYYADSLLQGFRNSHWIVGGCTQDYGSMTIMPLTGRLRCAPDSRASRFSHEQEVARPDYYKVYLPDEGVTTEMTATSRCAMLRMSFDKSGRGYLVINPNSDEGEGFIAVDTARNMVYGYNPVHRIYQGKGQPAGFSGHFVVEFSAPIADFGCYVGDTPLPGLSNIAHQPGIGCYVEFDVSADTPILVKVASSFTGHEGALSNMQQEMPHWDFDAAHSALSRLWSDHLGSIEVSSPSRGDLAKFYGAFYRASFLPHEVNDVDGRYCSFASGYPLQQLPEGETAYYDDFSMWDTYRALHPFIFMMFPDRGGEMMQSLVHKYEQAGWLPIFPCWNSYTAAMIGDHCIAAICDAYVKGIRNFDVNTAYKAMRQNAFDCSPTYEYADGKGRRALASYLKYGYVPLEDSVPDAYHKREQVSRTLEYAFDDFALAQMARALGHEADYQQLAARAHNYAYVINPATGYADGRYADGRWAFDDPFAFSKHFTEGVPCHYTWYVPHDPYGLMSLMGGKDKFVAKLDSVFSERRYWHGNEPCHQVPFMYNFAGQQWKTAQHVRHIMATEYLDDPGGLSGNDDAGQMSAWYLFAALGFYPVCPASSYYMISGPTFPSALLHLPNGRDLTILAPKASDRNIYIRRVTRDGLPYDLNYISHDLLMEGGTWIFEMSDRPNKRWGMPLSF